MHWKGPTSRKEREKWRALSYFTYVRSGKTREPQLKIKMI